MSKIFEYVEHPRIAQRKAEHPVRVRDVAKEVHGQTLAGRINAAVGLRITVIVGTMWCAYVFAAIALISLKDNLASTQELILWISSSFLQLVLLPIIIVGQNIQATASDKRSEQTYKDAEAVLQTALQIQKHLAAQDAALENIMSCLPQGAAIKARAAAQAAAAKAPAKKVPAKNAVKAPVGRATTRTA